MKRDVPEDAGDSSAKEDWNQRKEMEALLAEEEGLSKRLLAREPVWVSAVQIASDGVLVDVGEKKEGFVPASDFNLPGPLPKAKGADMPRSFPKPGERIPVVYVGRRPDGAGLFSHKKAKAELSWAGILKAFREKTAVFGRIQSAVKGGFLVDLSGVAAFMPHSQTDVRPVADASKMPGKGIKCRVIEIDEAARRAVVSRRAVLEEEMAERRAKLLKDIKVGEIRFGRIAKTASAGLLVDIGGLRGLVRSCDVAWGEISAPLYKRGDKIRVKVLEKEIPAAEGENQPRSSVYFGVKQLLPNPAEALKRKYPAGVVVSGTVVSVDESGVVFKIGAQEPGAAKNSANGKNAPAGQRLSLGSAGRSASGLDRAAGATRLAPKAFCPASQVDPDTSCAPGDAVSAVVLGIDQRMLRLNVSIKRHSDKIERARLARYLKAPAPMTLGELLSGE